MALLSIETVFLLFVNEVPDDRELVVDVELRALDVIDVDATDDLVVEDDNEVLVWIVSFKSLKGSLPILL